MTLWCPKQTKAIPGPADSDRTRLNVFMDESVRCAVPSKLDHCRNILSCILQVE